MDKMLILKCCGHSEEEDEINNIISQSNLYGFETIIKSPCDIKSLQEDLVTDDKYKYIYLSAHGDSESFGNSTETLDVPWLKFAETICLSECLTKDAILLLSCCRGGLNEVAYTMFWSCPDIQYICGPRQNIESSESMIGFNILLFNMIYRDLDPLVACDNIRSGVNIRFKCFDRLETISESGYILFKSEQEQNTTTTTINNYFKTDSFFFDKETPFKAIEILFEIYKEKYEERKKSEIKNE